MKIKYQILDTESNRARFPELIGQFLEVPPPNSNVAMIKERESLFDLVWDSKNNKNIPTYDFMQKSLKEGYEQKDVIESLMNYYHFSEEESKKIFQKYIILSKGLHKNLDKLLQKKKEGGAMSWYKKASNDFTDVDVRRMNGILSDFQTLSRDALIEMDKWIANGETNITLEEAKNRLSYYLTQMGIE